MGKTQSFSRYLRSFARGGRSGRGGLAAEHCRENRRVSRRAVSAVRRRRVCVPHETGLKELPKARFVQAVHALNQNQEDVVTVYFYNRADHTRQVAISVDYTSR